MLNLSPDERADILRGAKRGNTSIDASDAPRHMQDRIIEIRIARAEKRADPAPSAEYIAEARNYAATARSRRTPVIMPATRRRSSAIPMPPLQPRSASFEEQYRRQTGHEYVSQQEIQMRLHRQAKQIEREAATLVASQAEAARAAETVRAELFPWES